MFFTHLSDRRAEVAEIADYLRISGGFSCFVAHTDIEPSRSWQDMIEIALGSMDALVAYLTPGFHESKWTDQETGWALARGVVILPVSRGLTPYGFLARYQALHVSDDESPWNLAYEVIRGLAIAVFGWQRPGAAQLLESMANAVVRAFCSSENFAATRRRFPLLRLVPGSIWTDVLIQRLRTESAANNQISNANLLTGKQEPKYEPALEAIERLIDMSGVRGPPCNPHPPPAPMI